MALMELSSVSDFDCSRLVVCLDRDLEPATTKTLMRNLGWVGFELTTLASWVKRGPVVSSKWLFLGVDV